jgi:ribosome maturation factor RimP
MIKTEDIVNLSEGFLSEADLFLVDVIVKPGNKIFIYIDGDESVTIQDCVNLSRHIESSLDRDKDDFELNVSSAGIDQPLKLPRQYHKNIGRDIKVLLKDGSRKKGRLVKVEEETIEIETAVAGKKKKRSEPELVMINLSDIKETKVSVSF